MNKQNHSIQNAMPSSDFPHPLPNRSVPSGSYIISNRKKERLTAFLGSCVGVALHDPKADIGGLIHLLLPEPTGLTSSFCPAAYATTGLPLMMEELFQKGANQTNIEACLAGGALVGPLSDRDLLLNIGGRIVETVEEILARNKIKIVKSETGGFFSCCLSLDLSNWQTRIDPIGLASEWTNQNIPKPEPGRIEAAMEDVQPIPQVALKIIRMLTEENYHFEDIAHEVRQDQVISARILSLCCSAYYGLRLNIDSIDRALLLLGEKKFLQVVVSASLERFFPSLAQGYSLCKGGLYKHALAAALINEQLARLTKKVSPDLAYTAGLLHDIGKVVLDQYLAPIYPLFYRRTQIEREDLVKVEKEQFGIDHCDLGGRLGERWSLPPVLLDAIRFHHHPSQSSRNPELTHLIYLTDILLSCYVAGQILERLNDNFLNSSLKTLDIDPDHLPVIIDNLPRQLFTI